MTTVNCGMLRRVPTCDEIINPVTYGIAFIAIAYGIAFIAIVDLKCHKRTHTSEKPHECTECSRTFKGKVELRRKYEDK